VDNLSHSAGGDPMRWRLHLLRVLGAGLLIGAAAIGCEDDGDLALVGTLERTQIELVAPASEVIAEAPVERGREVTAGTLVVRLDPTLARVEARRAEAALARARTADRVAEHELERMRELVRTHITSQQDLERAELERDEAGAGLREAEATFEAARKHVADLELRAPVDAVVDQLPYEEGERVPLGAVLAVLVSTERPWVRVWVPEPRLAGVRPGLAAEVSVDGWPEPLRGRVLDVAREPTFTPHFALTERERAHLAYETRVEVLDAPDELRSGIPATVRLLVEPASAEDAEPTVAPGAPADRSAP